MLLFSRGINNENMSEFNRSVVLQYLKRNGVCSRADIAKETGLTEASISKIISTMIDFNIVREVGFISGEMGRRSKGIALNTDNYKVIGVKISRRSFSVGVFDIGGNDYDIHVETIDDGQTARESIGKMREVIERYADRTLNVIAVGIAVPGPYLKRDGRIIVMTETSGWEDIALQEEFADIRSLPVFLEHDANAAVIAEWWFGDNGSLAGGNGVMAYLLADEGIGAGIAVHGTILDGFQGFAGEIGHISLDVNGPLCSCGNRGCLESYCSSLAFVQTAVARLEQYPKSVLNRYYRLNADNIFSAANAGDEYAKLMVLRAGKYLGYGVINLIYAYNPSCIVIGNTMARGGDMLLSQIKETVSSRMLPDLYRGVEIKLSSFRIDPVLYGAAAIATDRFLKDPSSFI